MACHRLLKKDIVTLCKKRGLSVGKFTKAELIVQLEEDDRSKGQIPDPNWGYSRIWEQLEREPGIAKTPVPDQTRVFTIGFPIGGSRRTGLELSPREQEDRGRQREPEKELQKQQQHELAVVGRRGLGDLPGVSGDRSRGASSAGNLKTKLLPLVKEGEGVDAHLTAFEQAGDLNQGDPAEKPRCLAPLLGPKAIDSVSQMGGDVDRLPLLTPTYMSVWSFLGPGPPDLQWEQKVMVNGKTFLGWPKGMGCINLPTCGLRVLSTTHDLREGVKLEGPGVTPTKEWERCWGIHGNVGGFELPQVTG
nr:uncharacterized protein LOC125627901 [Caretta caretta]XP_048688464.1 uncharacterized protein LOC125627901 [Caretta caretta]